MALLVSPILKSNVKRSVSTCLYYSTIILLLFTILLFYYTTSNAVLEFNLSFFPIMYKLKLFLLYWNLSLTVCILYARRIVQQLLCIILFGRDGIQEKIIHRDIKNENSFRWYSHHGFMGYGMWYYIALYHWASWLVDGCA